MMIFQHFIYFSLLITCILARSKLTIEEQEKEAEEFLEYITPSLEKNLQWVYENNFKDKSKLSLVEQFSLEYDNEEVIEFFKKNTDAFKEYEYEKFQNKDLARQILLLISRDERVLEMSERLEFKELQEDSKKFISDIKFCDYDKRDDENKNCTLGYEYFLVQLVLSNDQDKIKWYWNEFTRKAGIERREKFDRYIELYRKIAKKNDFEKPSKLILAEYEDKNIFEKVRKLVNDLKPFYEQFHAYLRHYLRKNFGDAIPEKGPIPFNYVLRYHVLSALDDKTLEYPHPSSPIPDYEEAMHAKNYTAQTLIEEADEFFKSMGIGSALTKDWKEFIRRDDEAEEAGTCEPKARSYLAKGSLTFSYCDEINFKNFYNTHAQMLVVQQYQRAKDLPLIYRRLFPPAFEKALEKSMKYAVSTPAHMRKIGLMEGDHTNEELLLNRLYFLAFKVIVDVLQEFAETEYFYGLLDGNYNTSNSNCEYWSLLEKYVGIQPIGKVSNTGFDFIASSQDGFHDNDFEGVFSRFVAFNIYETLCKVSGKYEKGSKTSPLNNCDFSGNNDAGQLLVKVMKTGASVPWYKIFTEITLKDEVDASSILEYFEPLRVFVENENKKNNVHVGWESSNNCS